MTLVGNEGGATLYQQLKKLPDKVDLDAPLLLIVENLRKGGNIAAHFDLEKEPDQATAEAMVDLLDYFMEYIFVLKDRATALEAKLESLGKNTP